MIRQNSAAKSAKLRVRVLGVAALSPLALMSLGFACKIIGIDPVPPEVWPVVVVLIGFGVAWGLGFDLSGRKVLAASVDLLLAAAYLVTWFAPRLIGESRLAYFVWLVPVECAAVVCVFAVDILLRQHKITVKLQVVALLLFLAAISIAISYQVGHWWPLMVLALVGGNHTLSTVSNRQEGGNSNQVMPSWLFRFFAVLFLYVIMDAWKMPELGWMDLRVPELEEQLRAVDELRGVSPYSIVAFGFFYFLWVGLYGITGLSAWIRAHRPPGWQSPWERS